MLFGPKKITTIGLDISDSTIKAMQLSQQREGFFPSAYAIQELPKGLINNHMIVDESKLAEYITKTLKHAKNINTKYVVASVPEAKSFVRIVKIPLMSEAEMASAIPFELEQDIPVPINQVYLDYQLARQDGDSMEVVVVATPKDYVDSLVKAFKLAKLKPVAMILESQATARALIGNDPANQATLIVDMSNTQTTFVIVSGAGVLEYTSSLPMGGGQMTENISKALGLGIKEAEQMKRDEGLTANSKKGNVRQAVLSVLDSIVDEIRNVLNYYEAHSILGAKVNKVILCGGTANLIGLGDYVQARLNVGAGRPIDHIITGDPLFNAVPEQLRHKVSLSQPELLSYTTAIGLALRGMQDV